MVGAADASQITFKADPEERPHLLALGGLFYVPPYVGNKGWLGMRLTGRPDWSEVAANVLLVVALGGYRSTGMEAERVTASTTIEAAPEAVFAVLADPSAHADIDGTGWVRASLDADRITAAGQVFRMEMYHEGHPDKDYEIANLVVVFDAPRAIAWKPGTESPETGELSFGGWIWRYDLEATGPSRTRVTLTYDWSAVPPDVREYLQFPPFGPDHLDNSLQHVSDLVGRRSRPGTSG